MTFYFSENYNKEPVIRVYIRPRNQGGNNAVLLEILKDDSVTEIWYKVEGMVSGKVKNLIGGGYLGGGPNGTEFSKNSILSLGFPDDASFPRLQIAPVLNGEYLAPWSVEYIYLG